MKNELTYSEAFLKLVAIVEQLEQGDIQLDKLSMKVKQANELIAICDTKLRDIETDIEVSTNTLTIKPRNKNESTTD